MPRRIVYLLTTAALLLAAGCASGTDSGSTTPSGAPPTSSGSTSSQTPASADAAKVVEVTASVRDGKATPKPRRVQVPVGSTVRLQVTSDVDDEVHVHGFDVEEPLAAGRPTTIELHAEQPGLFEVETHETELELLQLEVR